MDDFKIPDFLNSEYKWNESVCEIDTEEKYGDFIMKLLGETEKDKDEDPLAFWYILLKFSSDILAYHKDPDTVKVLPDILRLIKDFLKEETFMDLVKIQ
jgi:hypothetical protein